MAEDKLFDQNENVFGDSSNNLTDVVSVEEPLHRTLRPRKSSEILRQSELTKKIRAVARKTHRSVDDELFLEQHQDLVKVVETRKLAYSRSKERSKELLDDETVLQAKVDELANLLSASKHAIVYTGAGISTSANIPDYRGVDGIWTQICAGQDIKIGQNPTNAVPTFTHMAIKALMDSGVIKHATSQNCDGLHIRSGLRSEQLSELHGNMYAEICSTCGKSYYRLFDVTEKTALRRHKTQRYCDLCEAQLRDTIVHFGELSESRWPHNWIAAEKHAEECDLILCLGSSLKVLRSYKKLWLTDRRKSLRPTLCIVNIQWTPKDSQSQLKINGRTDDVLRRLMEKLSITVPDYLREDDLLFRLATPLTTKQGDSYHTNCVLIPQKLQENFKVEQTKYEQRLLSASQVSSQFSSIKQCNVDEFPLARSNSLIDSVLPEDHGQCSHHQVDSSVMFEKAMINNDVPAWFGKGCRKAIKKKGKIKHRRQTN